MKKTAKRLLTLSFAGMIVTCLSACGIFNDKTSEPTSSSLTSEEIDNTVIELDPNYKCTLKLLIPSGNENETTMIDKLIEGFQLKFPDISFKKNYVSVNSYESTVRNQWLAGSLPDIVWSNSPDFYYLVDAGIAEPLNAYYEKSKKEGVFDLEQDFLKEYFDIGAKNGNYYMVPRSADSVVTFYNKKLLTEAGIDLSVIQNGWTWETFLDVNKQYRAYLDSKGKGTYYVTDANLTTWLSTCYPILRSYGGEVIDQNKKVVIDSQETRNALNMVHDMMEKKYIVASGDTSGSSFEAGTSPFLFQSASVSLFAERRELKGNIDIVSFPLIQDHSTPKIGTGIAGYAMNKKTKEKAACWQFLNYMMSKEGQELMAEGGLNLPSIRKDLSDYNTAKWGEGYRNFNLSAYTYGSEYKLSCEFLSYADSKYKADLDLAVKDLFYNSTRSDKTVENAIASCVKDLNNALKN